MTKYLFLTSNKTGNVAYA